MEKLTLEKEKLIQTTKPIYVNIDTWYKISQLKADTGVPIGKIVDKFLRWGIKNVEIVEHKGDEE